MIDIFFELHLFGICELTTGFVLEESFPFYSKQCAIKYRVPFIEKHKKLFKNNNNWGAHNSI
jgi:hypothetical protein